MIKINSVSSNKEKIIRWDFFNSFLIHFQLISLKKETIIPSLFSFIFRTKGIYISISMINITRIFFLFFFFLTLLPFISNLSYIITICNMRSITSDNFIQHFFHSDYLFLIERHSTCSSHLKLHPLIAFRSTYRNLTDP